MSMRIRVRDIEGELCVAEVGYATATEYAEDLIFDDGTGRSNATGLYLDLIVNNDGTFECAFVPCELELAERLVTELFDKGKLDLVGVSDIPNVPDLVCVVAPDREDYYEVIGRGPKKLTGFGDALR